MSTVSSSSALLLVHLRSVALATQAAAVLLAAGGLGMQLPLAMDGLTLGALAFMNTLAWWYARRGDEPSAWVLTAQLALDIVGLTAFLYFNGGYANPFASLFLLPLAVAATVAKLVAEAVGKGKPILDACGHQGFTLEQQFMKDGASAGSFPCSASQSVMARSTSASPPGRSRVRMREASRILSIRIMRSLASYSTIIPTTSARRSNFMAEVKGIGKTPLPQSIGFTVLASITLILSEARRPTWAQGILQPMLKQRRTSLFDPPSRSPGRSGYFSLGSSTSSQPKTIFGRNQQP